MFPVTPLCNQRMLAGVLPNNLAVVAIRLYAIEHVEVRLVARPHICFFNIVEFSVLQECTIPSSV